MNTNGGNLIYTVDSPENYVGIPNSTYFYDSFLGIPLYKNSTGDIINPYVDSSTSEVLTATKSLTALQILDLNTTPIEILASPGSGKYYDVISVTSQFTIPFDGVGYMTNVVVGLMNTGATGYLITDAGTIIAGTVSRNGKWQVNPVMPGATDTQILTNTPLNIQVLTGNPEPGEDVGPEYLGLLKINILYRIVTL